MSGSTEGASTPILAVDTGGTFTDLLLLEAGRLRALKVRSTPEDPAQAVLDGVRKIAGGREPGLLLHGSTVGTNALLERKGARVLLITNRGFEDVIEIGRQNRPQLYALVGHRPPPLVGREDRVGIAGRLGPEGEELEPLDEEELSALAARASDAEAVAIVLLHSYADPTHEERVARALEGGGGPISVSSRLLPEYREYERASTTVVNAYVQPRMARYLERLDRATGSARVRVMGSNGGALPVERAAREAVQTVLSGPAGGVVGARAWARRAGYERIITFDMGGTSTDVSLCPGELLHTREFEIAGQPVAIPVLDIHTVGAGGGSLARMDPGGALRVGPESAGAHPGPICYGDGGEAVTVTDAHVWLGRLPVEAFLGGERKLDRSAVEPALARLAGGMGVTPDEAAEGILSVAATAMERALRVISVERGYDPSDFVVVTFGGAGGLHAAELVRRLGAAGALVPPDPGLLSAFGMLAAPVVQEASRTVLLASDREDARARMEDAFRTLEEEAVEAMLAEGRAREELALDRRVEARYRGQSFELRVPAEGWVDAFHRAHGERYGHARRDATVEAVTLRVQASAPGPRLEPARLGPSQRHPRPRPTRVRAGGRWVEGLRIAREELGAGERIRGPAVVTEYSSTTWVPEGWYAEVDGWACLHLLPET